MKFACTLCGDCCTGAQVIRLTGGDLQLLARRLGVRRPTELKKQGVVSLVREDTGGVWVWRPHMRFRTRPLRQCPFLVNDLSTGAYRGLCSLHPDFKPLVCALSPLARVVSDGDEFRERWSFVPPVEGCPGVGRGETVKLAAPAALKPRLDAETAWMRRLIAASEACPDEMAAWAWLDRWADEAWSSAS
jgi:Fe-S-cluster containining protein